MPLSSCVIKDWRQKEINPFISEMTESTCINITNDIIMVIQHTICFGNLLFSSLFKWSAHLRLHWVSISYIRWSLDFSRINLFGDLIFCASEALYRCEVLGHLLCIPSKFLCCKGGLRELWHGTLHTKFVKQVSLPQPAKFVHLVMHLSLLLLAPVDPRYLNFLTRVLTWPFFCVSWLMSWDPREGW